ncbi:hypothetical protein C0J52_27410 [Blattella germanica]|nr:hypothetical protein C0J52_27410 [Blattella germanica]
MFAPWLLPAMWSLPALVLWAGLAEEFLLPILLALCDRNFTAWVANIYTCRDRRVADLARQHQGLDGKFRVFNSQSLQQSEVPTSNQQQTQQQQQQQLPQEPVKFPITNGSLFTSVDGRLPIIHNYRRGKGKGVRTSATVSSQGMKVVLPNANTRRNEMLQTLITLNSAAMDNPHSDMFKRRTNSIEETRKLNQTFSERSSEFQAYLPSEIDTIEKKVISQVNQNSREDTESGKVLLSEFGFSNLNLDQQSDGEDDLNSEDLTEYNVDDNDEDDEDDEDEPIYATLSSRSCCSATTAANDDFEFIQHEEKISKLVSSSDRTDFSENGDGNLGQSLLYRYQREMMESGDRVSQAFQCADWTVDQNNEVLKLVLPLIESYQNQKDDKELPYQSSLTYEKRSPPCQDAIAQNASEILKTVIENELKNSRQGLSKGSTKSSSSSESKYRDSSSCSYMSHSELNEDSKSSCSQSLGGESQTSCESLNYKPHVTNLSRKKRVKKQNFLAGSLSLNNLDELLLEEDEDEGTIRNRSSRSSPNENPRIASQNEHSPDEREVVFQLPVKSESVLSLYRLDLDSRSTTSINKEPRNQLCDKQVSPRKRPTRYMNQQTPPTRRLHRHKKLPVPVLSVESLTTALNSAGVSYLDNGDLCRHGSVPDLKRVFVSDYL